MHIKLEFTKLTDALSHNAYIFSESSFLSTKQDFQAGRQNGFTDLQNLCESKYPD